MASLRRKRHSQYWYACYTLIDGSRVQRSTRETDRKKAQKTADAFEQVAQGQLTARQVQRVIAETFQRVTGDSLPSTSVQDYFEAWLARKKPETARSTYVFYRGKARLFLNWLGEHAATRELFTITSEDVVAFRTFEAARVSPSTVNHGLKVLRMIFEDAKRGGIIPDNPADVVRLMKRTGELSRRPFTILEIKRLLSVAADEWRSLILFGLYTGQRLGDLARLTWANIDFLHNEIRLDTSKTGRRQVIPLAPPLRKHIQALTGSDNPAQPLHPRAFASVAKRGAVGTLSRQFYEIMVKADLVAAKKHRASKTSAGRGGRRAISAISFHSFRHTATSLMKNAGVPAAVVQDIIGHESAAISASYTHIDDATKRIALAAMPDVL
ncbi:MAG: hypothetical protein QOI04_1554 [Verrucomicrobiota bacterium]|jgi:integrase